MKKILLTTSALVAMSSVALAGGMVDTTPAPAPMADGFTVEASGEAELFFFYTNDGKDPSTTTTGVTGDLDFTMTASKTVEDGSTISVEVGVDTNANIVEVEDFIIGYDSALGKVQIGTLDIDDHDVSVPGAPDVPHDEQADDDEDYYLELIEADDEGEYAEWSAPAWTALKGDGDTVFKTEDLRLTYATPALGGFQLGLGLGSDKGIDLALAGGMTTGDVEVKVGAGINGKMDDLGEATPRFGASVSTMGFTLGAEGSYHKNQTNEINFEAGVAYKKDAIEVGVSYEVANEETDKGMVTAGARYEENGVEAIVAVTHDLAIASDDKTAVFAGVVYNSDDFDASASYKGGQGATDIAKGVANAGVAIKAVENLEVVISGEYNLASEEAKVIGSAEYDATDALTVIASAGYNTDGKIVTGSLGAEFDVNSKLELNAAALVRKADAADATFGVQAGLVYTIYTDVTFEAQAKYDADSEAFGAKAGFAVEF